MLEDRKEQIADLLSIGGGAAVELFSAELKKVLENIRDPNTEAEDKRKIVITFEFKPDERREVVATLISTKAVMAASKPVSETVWLGRHEGQLVGTVVHALPEGENPRQGVLPLRPAQEG